MIKPNKYKKVNKAAKERESYLKRYIANTYISMGKINCEGL